MIPIRYVLLEGSDCCGKSTLYRNLHKATGFKYNIHDRSSLSMLCYARLYGRDETPHRDHLTEEVCDVNNFFVILMPPLETILERFRSRGDDFQDETSLVRLHAIFEEETSRLEALANVLVVREVMPHILTTDHVASNIRVYETLTPHGIGLYAPAWASLTHEEEVQLRVRLNVPLDHVDPDVFVNEHEGDYFREIYAALTSTISAEMSGNNVYGVPQGLDSRRFYYSSDTCISSIHFLMRGGALKVICTLRSTDAVKNCSIDLRFLAHVSAAIPSVFGWRPSKIDLDVRFNSLHVRK